MNEHECSVIMRKLSAKPGRALFNLFFKGKSRVIVKNSITSAEQILENIGVDLSKANSLEKLAIDQLLMKQLSEFKSQCSDRGQPWLAAPVSVQVGTNKLGEPIYKERKLYGFSPDVNKALATVIDSEDRARAMKEIAKDDRSRLVQFYPSLDDKLKKAL